jgi:MOSC domain-containing protein YiiM
VGQVERIWLKRFRRGPMDPRQTAELVAGDGIVDDANRGGKRQVTLISRERWNGLEEKLGARIDPAARRANVLLSGIDLEGCRGRVLRVGDCRLLLQGETRPCEAMDAAHPGLQEAMRSRWGGGAWAEILGGGRISVGDAADWE